MKLCCCCVYGRQHRLWAFHTCLHDAASGCQSFYLPRINIKSQKIVSPKAGWQKSKEGKEAPSPEGVQIKKKKKTQKTKKTKQKRKKHQGRKVGNKTWCSISNSDRQ